jgi:N-acetylneuraminic acid mutarotase
MYEYDTLHDTWIKRNNMLFAKANFSLCSMNDRVYSFGGLSTSQVPLDIVEHFDIAENKWTYFGKMPTPFVAGCVVNQGEHFYVLGGRNGLDLGRHDTCYMFTPSLAEWTEIDRMLVGRFNFGACVLSEKIFVFGGQRYDESEENYFTREALDSVEIYDLKSRKWKQGPKMPAPLYNTGVCVFDEQRKCIYVCGTTECKYSKTKLFGFMFTSVFRLEFIDEEITKWSVVEHDVSEIKTYYRCIAARVCSQKLHQFKTDIHLRDA